MTNRSGVPVRSSISLRNGTVMPFHFTNRNAVPVRSGPFRALIMVKVRRKRNTQKVCKRHVGLHFTKTGRTFLKVGANNDFPENIKECIETRGNSKFLVDD